MTAGTSTTADPTVGAAINIVRKPGQRWEYGPVCFDGEHRAYVTELGTYLDWVGQVDKVLNDFAAAVQRIRMLYYGQAIGNLELIDKLLNVDPVWQGAPLTVADVRQETLDGLARTGWVSVGANQDRRMLVDIGRVWLQLDIALHGISDLGNDLGKLVSTQAGPAGQPGLPGLSGLLGWAGDLAASWIEYNDQKICQPTAESADLTTPTGWLNAGKTVRCPTDAVFGDMDGMILAGLAQKLTSASPPAAIPTLTSVLTQYYTPDNNAGATDRTILHSDNRFHLFAWNCAPVFPVTPSVPTAGGAALTADSGAAIQAIVTNAITALLGNARGINPMFMKGLLEYPPTSSAAATEREIQQSVATDLGSTWGTAMAGKLAQDFTNFLTAGLAGTGWTSVWTSDGTSDSWPTSVFAIDSARGGFALQLGDSDASGTYGGTAHTAASYVSNLQTDLITLGFDGMGPASGVFGGYTATTLREFQIEASQQQIYVQTAGPPVSTAVLPVIRRYQGPINGVATLETYEALAHWLQPSQPRLHCLARPGPGQGLAQIKNPVSISTRNNVDDAGNNGTIATSSSGVVLSDMWWYDPTGTNAVPLTPVYAADQLRRYAIPADEVVGTDPGLTCIGHWTTSPFGNGPVLEETKTFIDWWDACKVSLANLVPASFDHASPAVLSQYRVVRAVAQVEDIGHYDVYNAWDAAILSFGLLHWALMSNGVGELGAFLSFYQNLDPPGFAADFGGMGVQPGSAWDPSTLNTKLLTYNNTLALFGLHDANGAIQANRPLPLDPTSNADGYLGDYMRSWRSLHRVVMTLRNSTSLRAAMWYFATQRVHNLLSATWPGVAYSYPDQPVVTVNGVQQTATIGQVFTSEQAVAALLRWHVNQPASLLTVSPKWPLLDPIAIHQAFTGTFTTATVKGNVDVGAIAEPTRTQLQQFLVRELIGLAQNVPHGADPGGLSQTIAQAAAYNDTEIGSLSADADSYKG